MRRLLTRKELCELLGISYSTLNRLPPTSPEEKAVGTARKGESLQRRKSPRYVDDTPVPIGQ